MEDRIPRWTDERVEQWIGGLLRAGVIVAAAIAVAGALLYLPGAAHAHPALARFHAVAPGLDTAGGVLRGGAELRGPAASQLGLLALIATPIARVALSLVAFAVQRDRLYTLITLFVLALLLYSLLGPGMG